ncbi:MAG: hypothetical protein ACRDJ9_27910, partial [Dehalococcoidia bacterium]
MRLVIVGAGDHGRVLLDLANSAGHEVLGFVQPSADGSHEPVGTVPVIGSLARPEAWRVDGLGFSIALGDNARRRAAWESALQAGLIPVALEEAVPARQIRLIDLR